LSASADLVMFVSGVYRLDVRTHDSILRMLC
jgi:hypothetical protein